MTDFTCRKLHVGIHTIHAATLIFHLKIFSTNKLWSLICRASIETTPEMTGKQNDPEFCQCNGLAFE